MKYEMKMMKVQSSCAILSCFSAISAKLQPALSKLRKSSELETHADRASRRVSSMTEAASRRSRPARDALPRT